MISIKPKAKFDSAKRAGESSEDEPELAQKCYSPKYIPSMGNILLPGS